MNQKTRRRIERRLRRHRPIPLELVEMTGGVKRGTLRLLGYVFRSQSLKFVSRGSSL